MDIMKFARDLYFECKYLNETKFNNIEKVDIVVQQSASLCVKNILEMLNKFSLEEIQQVKKAIAEVQSEEIKFLEPIQRVDEDKYSALVTLVNHACFDALMYCAYVERGKLDEIVE